MAKEFWDARYGDDIYAYGIHPNRYFKKVLDNFQPGKLLLPGEGEGRNAVYAARKKWDVTAIDLSISGKKKAELLAETNKVNITYVLGDIQDYPLIPGEFDVIALIFFHLSPEIRAHYHRRFINSLKTGGYLLIEAFSKDQLGRSSGGPPVEELLYNRYLLKRDFQTLEIMELYETEEYLDEGPFHQGKAALVRMLAKK